MFGHGSPLNLLNQGQAQDAYDPADEQGYANQQAAGRGRRHHRGTAPIGIRRIVGITLMGLMAFTIFHVTFRTDVLDPLLALVGPAREGVDWVLEDPKRAWGAAAVIVVPHIGLYYMLFEDR